MNVVTGVFSYTGSFIARRLLESGEAVKTLSRRPDPSHPLASDVAFGALRFDDEAALAEELRGATTLYNTFWIRFPRGDATWASVIANTRVLLRAARRAEVRRLVHVSVSNPSETSPLPYFRHKAIAERLVRDSGLSHAIVRPTLVFGEGDILLNNIAWALRRFPLFVVPTGGGHRVQPVAALDVARIAVEAAGRTDDVALDAAGPDVWTFERLVAEIRQAVGSRTRVIRGPATLSLLLAGAVGRAVGDVMLTRQELRGLRDDLLVSSEAPEGRIRLRDWLGEHGAALGTAYASELERNWREQA